MEEYEESSNEATYWKKIRNDLNRTNPTKKFLQNLKELGPNKLRTVERKGVHIEIKSSSKK